MTADRAAAIVRHWTRCYTRRLPPAVAERRTEEIASDLHEHIAHERAAGTPEGRIARQVLGRGLRGLHADVTWREHELRRRSATTKEPHMSRRAAITIVLVTLAVLAIPAVLATPTDGEGWSAADFVLGAALLLGGGVAVERVLRRPPGLLSRLTLGATGAVAMVLGELDDAPGLVGFGLLIVLFVAATTARDLLGPSPRSS